MSEGDAAGLGSDRVSFDLARREHRHVDEQACRTDREKDVGGIGRWRAEESGEVGLERGLHVLVESANIEIEDESEVDEPLDWWWRERGRGRGRRDCGGLRLL